MADRLESETEIIASYLAPLAAGFPGAFGLGDDCALLTPTAGRELVLTTDSLIEGAHFLADDIPAYKALAVNVSDLVAKGAEPLVYLLTLALPVPPTHAWMAHFAAELARAQLAFRCHLAGGDTDRTPGPLTITIAAVGTVPVGELVRRSTANVGDRLYVTGTIGDAWLGLGLRMRPEFAAALRLADHEMRFLLARHHEPTPRTGLVSAVRACASACLDVSDGLVKDLGHMCRASAVGARVEAGRIPLSGAAARALAQGTVDIGALATGGEDYELLMAVPGDRAEELERRAAEAGIAVAAIGTIVEPQHGVTLRDASGRAMVLAREGWDHFATRGGM